MIVHALWLTCASRLASGQRFFRVYEGHCILPAVLRMEPYSPLVYSLIHSGGRTMLFLQPIPGAVCSFSFRLYNDSYVSHLFPFLPHSLFLTQSHTHNHSMTEGSVRARDDVEDDPEHS